MGGWANFLAAKSASCQITHLVVEDVIRMFLGNTSEKSVDFCSEKSVMCPTDIDGRVSIPNRETA